MVDKILSREWMVKPSDCNANQELPLTMLVAQMIELATDHANLLGIGFLSLESKSLGWVLSRLSVEMARWPKNGEKYTLATWIESYNTHFSERCFSVTSDKGQILGYARTVWVIIDLQSHKSVGTAGTSMPEEMIAGIECPIPRMMRHKGFEPSAVTEYTFRYTDLDFYRHVNTVKYISLLLNQYTLDEFDSHLLSRFDIAFAKEAKYNETVRICSMKEEVETPCLVSQPLKSYKRSFDLRVNENTILTSSIIMSEL